jgi:putative ABC transport system ATP-binding protein
MQSEDKPCEIKLVDIKKTFIMGEVEVPVLRGVNLEISRGEVTVVLGASGSGKSTLLNIIGGVDKPSSGRILFHKEDIAGFDDHQLTLYRRNNIGFVFQFYNLVSSLTAKENIEVSTEIAENPMDPEKVLELVNLSDKKDHFPAQMSGGEQQRVSIARALAKPPRLMLCDEPTGALDVNTGQRVLKTLMDVNERLKTSIIIITHATPIAKLAHKVLHLKNGVIADTVINEKRARVEEIEW